MSARRWFLKRIAGVAATAALPIGSLAALPVQQAAPAAPIRSENSNELLTPTQITRESLRILNKSLDAWHS